MQTPTNRAAPNEITPLGERRAHRRHPLKSFVYARINESNGGIVADASESGAQIMTPGNLTVGELVEISLRSDVSEHPIKVIGRTVWLDDSHRTAGLQFVDVTENERRRVGDWIAHEGGDAESTLQKPAAAKGPARLTEELEQMFPSEASPNKPAVRKSPTSNPEPRPAVESVHPLPEFPTQLHRSLYERRYEPPTLSEPPGRSTTARIAVIVSAAMVVSLAVSIIAVRSPQLWRSLNKATPTVPASTSAPAADPSGMLEPSEPTTTPRGSAAPPSSAATDDSSAAGPTTAGSPPLTPSKHSSTLNHPAISPPVPAGAASDASVSGSTGSVAGNSGTAAVAQQSSEDDAIMVTPPTAGSAPALVSLPRVAITASDVVAIGVQSSALVSPNVGVQHRAERLEFGKIAASPPAVSLPAAVARENTAEIVRLRAVIDDRGEIKSLDASHGRPELITLSESLVRQWNQTPARLNGRPIESFEDITLNFRRPQ